MGTPTLAQTKTIFKVVANPTQVDLVAVDGVVCAIPQTMIGRAQLATLGEYANAVEQARDEFVAAAVTLQANPNVAKRDAYEEAFLILQRAICKSWRAQRATINQFRVAQIRGGIIFYGGEP